MKKIILFLLLLLSVNCIARSIFDIIINKPESNSSLSSFFGYDDLYFYEKPSGLKKYLNRKSAGISFKPGKHSIEEGEIIINRWDFFSNNLSALEDRIKFESESIKINLNAQYNDFIFGFSSKFTDHDIKYNMDIFNGNIPISYFQFCTNVNYKNLKLNLNLIKGNEQEESFSNKISGYSSGLSFDVFYVNTAFSIQGDYINFSADLSKDNSSFCELNGIQFLQYSCVGKYNFYSFNSISGGIIGFHSWQKERSFFDAEPFISYYSLIFGSKTFIKKLDIDAMFPFVTYNHKLKIYKIPFSASLDYYHIFTDSDIVYTERKWIIPGVWPDDTTRHNFDVNPSFDGIFRLQIKGNLVYKELLFGIIGSQLLPIDYSKLSKPEDPSPGEEKASEHGGTSIALTVGYLF